MHVRNAHSRAIRRHPREVFRDLERMGTEHDDVWPTAAIPFERTPGPLKVGETSERHGIIRAVLDELKDGEKLVWRADQAFLRGTHGFQLTKQPWGCDVAHVLDARLAWWFAPVWIFKMRRLHDQILEGLLDRLENHASSDA